MEKQKNVPVVFGMNMQVSDLEHMGSLARSIYA